MCRLFALIARSIQAVCFAMVLFSGTSTQAQEAPSALIADSIRYDAGLDALIASGNVEIIFGGRVLRAQSITYFNKDGAVSANGPLTLASQGEPTLVAQAVELSDDLSTGLIHGARLVLAENFQIAANEARKLDDQRTGLYKAVASACHVCDNNETPLWLIRAERIVHDNKDLQIHFSNVSFEAFGITIGYLPYFRLPDPSVKRATGFLTPEFTRSDFYKYGIKLPYFIVIANDKDITITPFVTSTGAALFEGEYRQRFNDASLNVGGAVALTSGTLPSTGLRGYFAAYGDANLPRGFELDYSLTNATDKGFMRQFAYSDADRLRSQIEARRQSGNEYVSLRALGFQSLRDRERNAEIPNVLPEFTYRNYWDDPSLGGRLDARANASVLVRRDGRDVGEAGGSLQWQREFSLPSGIRAKVMAGTDGRVFLIQDDPALDGGPSWLVTPMSAVELRWPFARRTDKSTQVIEPVFQAVYSESFGDTSDIPNEDSPTVEFDAANLFALNRYPGNDIHEQGLRFNIGTNFTRIDPDGWSIAATIGQVFRIDSQTGFPDNTGLNKSSSNIVAAVNLDLPPVLQVSNQSLFDEQLNFSRNDVQARLNFADFALDGSYVYLAADPANASPKQHEVSLSSQYRFADHWSFDASWRRNLATGDNVSAIAGLEYGNECIRARFSVSRRFTNSTSLPPGTDYGLTVRLAGFGGGSQGFPARKCVRFKRQ